MVATVGSISIDLSTNVAKFATGFKGAATTVERESGRMSKALASIQRSSSLAATALSSFGTGILAGAGLASITGLIGKARDAIGELDDIADRAKSSGLGTDLLQSLEHGAQQAGIEVDTLSGGLQFFAKGMGQAAEGTGRLYSGLLKLNPVLLRSVLNTSDQEERLKLVADALDKAGSASERAALSAALFGDVDFGRLFEGGAASIDKMVAAMDGKLFTPEQIKQAGEYDTALNDLQAEINKTVDGLLINLGPALVETGKLFLAGATGVDDYIKRVHELSSSKSLADFLLGPKGGGGISGFFRDLSTDVDDLVGTIGALEKSAAGLRQEIMKTLARGNDPTDLERSLAKILAQVTDLRAQLAEPMAVNIDTREAKERIAELAELFRKSENASMAGLGGRLPTVHGGSGGNQDVNDEVERAVNENTRATGAGLSRVEQAVQSSGASVAAALSYRVPAGGGYATGAAANSFKYSGNDNPGSWAGRRFTFGGGGDYSTPSSRFGPVNLLAARGAGMAAGAPDTSSISSGGGAGSVVNVVVKPVLVGERLSVQSRAEIKQAAAEGANAALRAYNGR